MQAAGLLTFDDPTLFKPPPDHPLPAKLEAKPYVVRAEDVEPDEVRESKLNREQFGQHYQLRYTTVTD